MRSPCPGTEWSRSSRRDDKNLRSKEEEFLWDDNATRVEDGTNLEAVGKHSQ